MTKQEIVKLQSLCNLCKGSLIDILTVKKIPLITPDNEPIEGAKLTLVDHDYADLTLCGCISCENLQLRQFVDPSFLYRDFRYVSKRTLGLTDHFAKIAKNPVVAEKLLKHDELASRELWIDIGCNDGSFLRNFAAKRRLLGVEPATLPAQEARSAGLEVIEDFFSSNLARAISMSHGKASVVFCANTLANVQDLKDFVSGLEIILEDDGIIVIDTQDGDEVLKKTLIDTIYHEHLYYFRPTSLAKFFGHQGFKLVHLERHNQKGGSFTAIFCKEKNLEDRRIKSTEQFDSFGDQNQVSFDEKIKEFTASAQAKQRQVYSWLEKKRQLIGYGASVGTITQAVYFGLEDVLDLILDDNPMVKHLRLGSNPPVVSLEQASQKGMISPESHVFLFAYRYREAIFNKHGKFFLKNSITLFSPFN